MSGDLQATEKDGKSNADEPTRAESNDGAAERESEEEDDEDDEDEPKLKYTKLTGNVAGIYRNNDSTSAFTVAGDKMVTGTHNGNIHVLSLPSMESLRLYHAHSATITSVSVSPTPPPPSLQRTETGFSGPAPTSRSASIQSQAPPQRGQKPQPQIPNTPNNQIYVATSSLDGHVCVSSLVDPKDVQLRNFARPVKAVALSPDFKNDRTYLSGGLAGNLVLTVGGKAGVSSDANTNSTAAAASGWLSSFGLGSNTGKDTVLHSGEGAISTIKWSLTGKWVVWVNEEGIKIMRSHLKLDSESSEDMWKRIAHAQKPHRKNWTDMAAVWKARAEWISDKKLESDELVPGKGVNGVNGGANTTTKKVEKLVVGWGDTVWVLHVHEGGTGAGKEAGKRQVGTAEIPHKLQFRDCVVSGLSLYTPSMLAILAYRTRDDDDKPIAQANDTQKKGRHHRQTGLPPQLRLVDVASGEEVDLDELSKMSRFESLSAQDYHLGTMYMPTPAPRKESTAQQRGTMENLWEYSGGGYATRMFTTTGSVLSKSSSQDQIDRGSAASPSLGSMKGVTPTPARRSIDAPPFAANPGLKLFIHSPYDCVLAVKRDLSDHLEWLVEHHQYSQAWQLLDDHPEVIDPSTADTKSVSQTQSQAQSQPSSPSKAHGSLAEFFADDSSSTTATTCRAHNSVAQKEKRRIGDLWLQQLISTDRWAEAGKVAGKVLGTSSRWEHWVWTFAQASKFDDITPFIPSTRMKPPLPSLVYEVVLGHYITVDRPRLQKLLEEWDPELFDVSSVVAAIESRLDSREVTEDTVEDGVQGRDYRILLSALAKLYLAEGRARDALRCFIRTQNADAAMALIKEEKLLDAVADDVPGVIMLRVSRSQLENAPQSELEEAASEATTLLVEEAHRGTVTPDAVVAQLTRRGKPFEPFLFFYLRSLWYDNGRASSETSARGHARNLTSRRLSESHALVSDHADLAVQLFATYDRELLSIFLRTSNVYDYETAQQICESKHYIPELIHVLSKTGQTKRALFLIIGELGDVKQAIEFTKTHPDLWQDLLEYSMDKPQFIRGLLEEVGTTINPIELVRRIPEGLEIPGLRNGLAKMLREHEIQLSISSGVARVLRGEVQMGMDTLRAGQKKAVRFEVVHDTSEKHGHEHPTTEVDLAVRDVPTTTTTTDGYSSELLPPQNKRTVLKTAVRPGHCTTCSEPFSSASSDSPDAGDTHLIGFACGHIFHLPCLLDANPETADSAAADDLLRQMRRSHESETADRADDMGLAGATAGARGYGGGRPSVGAKVAHAHVIGNVVKGGCVACGVVEGA
ncbi:hypothetical protein MBLNU230_g7173t1 [Neophaeotheca triangularis]